VTSTVSVENP